MRILFHPDFPKDIRRFEADYKAISDGLGTRFRQEILEALDAITLIRCVNQAVLQCRGLVHKNSAA